MAEFPGTGDVHVDRPLTNLSVGYFNKIFIARQMFPRVLVNFQSDIIPKYDKSHFFRLRAKKLTERESPPIGGYIVDNTNKYYCDEWGFGHFVSDRRKANTDLPYNADRDGTLLVSNQMDLSYEYQFVNNFWKTGVWANDEVGTTDFVKWSTYGTSYPIQNIRGWMRTVRRALGGWAPNVLTLGDLTWDVLADHPQLLDRIKYGSDSNTPAKVTPNLIAQLLGIEKILVGMSTYTTDPAGTAEASVTYTPMWDDDGLLMYVPDSPSLFTPAAGYSFVWRTVLGGPRYMRRRRDYESDKGELLEAFEWYDMKAVALDAATFISDAVD